jgi:hypothetical protein
MESEVEPRYVNSQTGKTFGNQWIKSGKRTYSTSDHLKPERSLKFKDADRTCHHDHVHVNMITNRVIVSYYR